MVDDDRTDQANETELHPLAPESEERSQVAENQGVERSDEIDVLDWATDGERARMHDVIAALGRLASLTIADTYETEQMGVLIDSSRRALINAECIALNRNLAETSRQMVELEETMSEIQRGIGSLQFMIDPENN